MRSREIAAAVYGFNTADNKYQAGKKRWPEKAGSAAANPC